MQSEYTPRPRRSKAAFDALFASINSRPDIRSDAKIVYAKLTTMHRRGLVWTQTEIGEATGLSRHQVWRALGDLVRADLLAVKRVGLGRPNTYTLLGVDHDDIAGTADTPSSRHRRLYMARKKRLIELYGEMCLRCGVTSKLQIDHVIPRAAGGPDIFANLQLLCQPCNDSKGATTADYRQSPGVSLDPASDPA